MNVIGIISHGPIFWNIKKVRVVKCDFKYDKCVFENFALFQLCVWKTVFTLNIIPIIYFFNSFEAFNKKQILN